MDSPQKKLAREYLKRITGHDSFMDGETPVTNLKTRKDVEVVTTMLVLLGAETSSSGNCYWDGELIVSISESGDKADVLQLYSEGRGHD